MSKNEEDLNASMDDGGSFLDLNFVPDWAKRAPDKIHYSAEDGGARGGRRDRKRQGRSNERRASTRRDAHERRGHREEKGRRQHGGAEKSSGGPGAAHAGRGKPYRTRHEDSNALPAIPDLPLRVSFIPEQRQLNALVKQLIASRRAYPLMQIPKVFTQKPDTCCAKLEVLENEALQISQCRICGAVARQSDVLLSHLVRRHMTEFCEEEEIEAEAPSGHFAGVARCGLSGEWIGPPNHHSYNERIEEIRSSQYPHLIQEEYRASIETLRDDDSVDAWRQSCRVRKVFVFELPGRDKTEPLSWSAAGSYFIEHIAPAKMRTVSRAIVPLGVCRGLEDEGLREYIRREWVIERRRPRSLLFALRVALRHKKMHFFKMDNGFEFVSAVTPVPLDPEVAAENIRAVLEFLREHPGCKRKDLLGGLCPGAGPSDEAASEVLNPLRWLSERGHIIEFFDGTFSIAPSKRAKQ